jgi:hypothetical protein
MTILRDIFEKPVDRPIEGVIKADDDASLRIELEEYVLTNEIEKQIEKFLDAYKMSNGVQKGPPIGVEEGPPFRI